MQQLDFMESFNENMQSLVLFHDIVMSVLLFVGVLAVGVLAAACIKFQRQKSPVPAHFYHSVPLEVGWTLLPALIIGLLLFPSMQLLQAFGKIEEPQLTFKVVGYQWYWSYEFSDRLFKGCENESFEGRLLPKDEIFDCDVQHNAVLRQLSTDNVVPLPYETQMRCLVTSADVLHSWAVPSLGIKTDACPGRLNETMLQITGNVFESPKVDIAKVFAEASNPSAEALKTEYLKCWELNEKDIPKKIEEYEKCIINQKTMESSSKVPKDFSKTKPQYLYGQCSELCGTHHSFMPIVISPVENCKKFNCIEKILSFWDSFDLYSDK